jgi:hypothetical protein
MAGAVRAGHVMRSPRPELKLRKTKESTMSLNEALVLVKAAGYRVTKPRKPIERASLNAVGKPYSPQYDPNYRMKYKGANIARLLKPMPANTPWVQI